MRLKSREQFIIDANKIHNNEYDYSEVIYINNKTKIKIYCLQHGFFLQVPTSHLHGSGCPKCKKGKLIKNSEQFIKQANKIHDNKYDYSEIIYKNSKTKINILCSKHGCFFQSPDSHLRGRGCPKCKRENQLKTLEQFIVDANKIHNYKYNYSEIIYNNAATKIKINCPQHGFFYQTPSNHLQGRGCPSCCESKGERIIKKWLNDKNIEYISEKTFDGCKNKNLLRFDFYLPEYDMCIEYDGLQHFKEIEFWGGIERFKKTKINDDIKNQYCQDNNIKLIRITYQNINSLDIILNEKLNFNAIME